MIELICINENGIAYVKTECGKVFGIVNAFKVVDDEGFAYEGDVCSILEDYTDIDQDWENEANIIHLSLSDGESAKLVITSDEVTLM